MAGVLTANLVLQKTKLDNLKHVRKLNVCGVHINDIRVLRDAINVEVLSLSVNEIGDLDPLASCVNLRELYLRKNAITDVHQVLHLSKLPFLTSLTLSDNPIAQDPNYRPFCVAALPSLARFDDMDVSPGERYEAERTFPDLALVSPPPSMSAPQLAMTPPRPSSAMVGLTPRGVMDEDAVVHQRRSSHDSSQLARRYQELSSAFDDMPVGGRSSGVPKLSRGSGRVGQAVAADDHRAAAPTNRVAVQRPSSQGPREEGVVAAIKLLLGDLSPAALLDVRRHIDALAR